MATLFIFLLCLLAFSTQTFASAKSLTDLDQGILKVPKDIPPHEQYAAVARYLVHNAEWSGTGTNSHSAVPGFPMVNVISVADSERGKKSTGHIYYYLTDLDFTGQDLNADNKITFLFSQEQDLSCSTNKIDPMEPTCARVIVMGSRKILTADSQDPEYDVGRMAMLSRHPAAKHWEEVHTFYLCTIEIETIIVLDFYGGPHYVNTTDYYNANYDAGTSTNENSLNNELDLFIKIDGDVSVIQV